MKICSVTPVVCRRAADRCANKYPRSLSKTNNNKRKRLNLREKKKKILIRPRESDNLSVRIVVQNGLVQANHR